MNEEIQQQLHILETQHGVRILYCCESGSRAWGFASPDSDYDVRFIYAQPASHYLSIRERRDVIELPVNELLDIGGWDIRKALQLFLKTNAPLYEWLQSPIQYRNNGQLLPALMELMPAYFSPRAACHHYLSMARNTFENDLQGDAVRLKKYFYALRPLVAAMWTIEHQSVPPMEFSKLRVLVTDSTWQAAVDALLERKKLAGEKETMAPDPLLQQWISNQLTASKPLADAFPALQPDIEALDELFRKTIA